MYPKLTSDKIQSIFLRKGVYQINLTFEYPQFNVMSKGTLTPGFEEKLKPICSEELRLGTSSVKREGQELLFQSVNGSSCYDLFLPQATQRQGLFLLIRSKNMSGLSFRFVVDNPQQKVNIVDTKLDEAKNDNYIIIPPTSSYLYSGYSIHFRNISLDNSLSKNSIQDILVGTIPYEWIKSINITKNREPKSTVSETVSFEELNPSLYVVNNDGESKTIVLSQSFSHGWKAYGYGETGSKLSWFQTYLPFFFGTEIKEHVLVNNWANGWALRPSDTSGSAPQGQAIVIIFWPQYLEYLGFMLLGATLGIILLWKSKKATAH